MIHCAQYLVLGPDHITGALKHKLVYPASYTTTRPITRRRHVNSCEAQQVCRRGTHPTKREHARLRVRLTDCDKSLAGTTGAGAPTAAHVHRVASGQQDLCAGGAGDAGPDDRDASAGWGLGRVHDTEDEGFGAAPCPAASIASSISSRACMGFG